MKKNKKNFNSFFVGHLIPSELQNSLSILIFCKGDKTFVSEQGIYTANFSHFQPKIKNLKKSFSREKNLLFFLPADKRLKKM